MKQINIQGKRDLATFEFTLGNGQRKRFNSKREAGYFIAETNRFLTKCLVILNEAYIDIFTEYRRMWFVAVNSTYGTKTNYLDTQKKIHGQLDAAASMFEKFNVTWSGSNDPYFAFIDLRKAALFLHEASNELTQFYKKRNATSNFYTCSVLTDRCLLTMKRLSEYGENEKQ